MRLLGKGIAAMAHATAALLLATALSVEGGRQPIRCDSRRSDVTAVDPRSGAGAAGVTFHCVGRCTRPLPPPPGARAGNALMADNLLLIKGNQNKEATLMGNSIS